MHIAWGFLYLQMEQELIEIRPQKGFQETVLACKADIAIVGGAAGCGKTFLMLIEAVRNNKNARFGAVIFRRTTVQIKNEGGLWDESEKLYPYLGGVPKESALQWQFRSGSKIKFAHMEYEKNKIDWQGAQICMIGFDELTHFTEGQFWYLFSRNRSDCGIKPYIRATCNPDPDSWVAKLIAWWIDQDTGFPIPARSGVIRYFARDDNTIIWGDTIAEVQDQAPHLFKIRELRDRDMGSLIKSFTFISGSIYDNEIFIDKDPGYLGNLLSLQAEERSRLLEGNWLIRTDGMGLCDHTKIQQVFDNWPESGPFPRKCITCDAARFGKDLCVIFVWKGWEVIYTVIYKQSDINDVVKQLEELRRKFNIMKSDIIIDQDGVGGDVVKLGGYRGFQALAQPVKVKELKKKENYRNFKTQCAYRFCEERVNRGQVRFNINTQNCLIFDTSKLKGELTTKIKLRGVVWDVRDLIMQDLRSVKRAPRDDEQRLQIQPKEQQKNFLGRSPDFGDNGNLREALELLPQRKNISRRN